MKEENISAAPYTDKVLFKKKKKVRPEIAGDLVENVSANSRRV